MTGYSSRRSSCAPHGWSSPFSAELAGPDGLRAGQGPSAAASAARGRRSQRADRDAEAEADTDRCPRVAVHLLVGVVRRLAHPRRDLVEGLVQSRTGGLQRFVGALRRLAHLLRQCPTVANRPGAAGRLSPYQTFTDRI